MKPKKKLKGWVKFLIVLIILGGIFYFANRQFSLVGKVKNLIYGENETNEKTPNKKEPEPPKLQIFDQNSKSRVIGVSVNNNKSAWPHSGLQDAYLVYEVIAEGGITRLLAFYKDKDTEKIGSVRSARHYFLDYALENDAIFVHFGHSPQALSDIKSLSINNINGMYDASGFWRDKTLNKSLEHTAFTSMEKIEDVIRKKNYRTTSDDGMLLKYSITTMDYDSHELAQKADKVTIEYSSYAKTSYEYDEISKVYKLSMGGKAHIDAQTKEQYTVKNIIIYQIANTALDSKGRQELKNIGSGNATFITNGYAIPIKWEKTSRSAKTKYMTQDGDEIFVNDGNTWIHLQPKNKAFKIEKKEEPSSTETPVE